ncbi:MAG: hypothetical protein M1812_006177 [Candelaria pacifica]|nr:MAG: hypothetical protein M1812_006177 [Candelaria pacifica]
MPATRTTRTKTARTAPTDSTPAAEPPTESFGEAVQLSEAKIHQLESHISELYAFIDRNVLRSDVPLSVAKIMNAHPGSAQKLRVQLHNKVCEAYEKLLEDHGRKWSSNNSDNFIEAMMKFLPTVNLLFRLSNGAAPAFDVLAELGECSYGPQDDEWGSNEAPEGRPKLYQQLDELMLKIAKARWATTKEGLSEAIVRIEKTGKRLEGICLLDCHYFVRSLAYMKKQLGRR